METGVPTSEEIENLISKLGLSSELGKTTFRELVAFVTGQSQTCLGARRSSPLGMEMDSTIIRFRTVFRKHFHRSPVIDFGAAWEEAVAHVLKGQVALRNSKQVSEEEELESFAASLWTQLETEIEWIKALNGLKSDKHLKLAAVYGLNEFRRQLSEKYPTGGMETYDEAEIRQFSEELVAETLEEFRNGMPPAFVENNEVDQCCHQLRQELSQVVSQFLEENLRVKQEWDKRMEAASGNYKKKMINFLSNQPFATTVEKVEKVHSDEVKAECLREYGWEQMFKTPNAKYVKCLWDEKINAEYRMLQYKWNIVKTKCRKVFKGEFGLELSGTTLEPPNEGANRDEPLNVRRNLEKANANNDEKAKSSTSSGTCGDGDNGRGGGEANGSNNMGNSAPIPIQICREEEHEGIVSSSNEDEEDVPDQHGRSDENDKFESEDESRASTRSAAASLRNGDAVNPVLIDEQREVLLSTLSPSPRSLDDNHTLQLSASSEAPGNSANTMALSGNTVESEDENRGGDDGPGGSSALRTTRMALSPQITRHTQRGRRQKAAKLVLCRVAKEKAKVSNSQVLKPTSTSNINSQSGGEMTSFERGRTVVEGLSPRDLVKYKIFDMKGTSGKDVMRTPVRVKHESRFTSVDIGVEDDNYDIVFPANTQLPTAVLDFRGMTSDDKQTSVVSAIYEGAPGTAKILAEIYYPDIPPSEVGVEHLEFKMGIDECGILHVKWGVISTGQMFNRSIRTSAWCGTTSGGACLCQEQHVTNNVRKWTLAPIGVLGDDGIYDIIIQPNTTLPTEVYRSCAVTSSKGTFDKLLIYEGEQQEETPFKDPLGEILWTDIPNHGEGEVVDLDFTMQIDARGVLLVEWEVRASGRKRLEAFKTAAWTENESDREDQEAGSSAGSSKRPNGTTHGASGSSKKAKLEVSRIHN